MSEPNMFMERSADFSDCETFRYTLWRRWGKKENLLAWVLLNPSTANAQKDDPTNKKGIYYSMEWGYDSCCFVNLFAWRSTYPKDLIVTGCQVGPENDKYIQEVCDQASGIVVAFGNSGPKDLIRANAVLDMLEGRQLSCMGQNNDGTPKHPLYLKKSLTSVPFDREKMGERK